MDREIQFAKALEKVKKLGRLQGNSIRKEQVREAFAELSLDEAQLALVYDYLEKHQIGVDKKAEAQTVLSEEETDYLQEYLETLKELADIPDGEREAVVLSSMAGDLSAQRRLVEIFLPKVPEIR